MLGLLGVLGLAGGIPDDPVCAQMLDVRFWRPQKLCTLETTDFAVKRQKWKEEVIVEGTSVATLSSMIKLDENHWGAFLVADDAKISNLRLVIDLDENFNAAQADATITLEPFIADHSTVTYEKVEICVVDLREEKKGRPVVFQFGKYTVL